MKTASAGRSRRRRPTTAALAADTGFPPVSRPDARVLILGSMPGRRSLDERRYYAFPRNHFWQVMAALIELDPEDGYDERLAALTAAGIALWDTINSCRRAGSLDANIVGDSIVVNDFATFLADHRGISAILFNGARAADAFRRHAAPGLTGLLEDVAMHTLPSTSPANASYSLAAKIENWRIIERYLRG